GAEVVRVQAALTGTTKTASQPDSLSFSEYVRIFLQSGFGAVSADAGCALFVSEQGSKARAVLFIVWLTAAGRLRCHHWRCWHWQDAAGAKSHRRNRRTQFVRGARRHGQS